MICKTHYPGFNPRPRTGGDSQWLEEAIAKDLFQSTPPHGGRLEAGKMDYELITVSIHAPARGATMTIALTGGMPLVSIHAPARGATWKRSMLLQICSMFQSTPPHGGRRPTMCRAGARQDVSIHAPARGATAIFGSTPIVYPHIWDCAISTYLYFLFPGACFVNIFGF